MAMTEPSEELLDRHFRQQVASYKDVDQSRANQSDRLIIAKWMKVFERTPLSQKLARNGLMLLMHGHLKDFGYLKEPFADVRNCSRNLNDILDEYRGESCKGASLQDKINSSSSVKTTNRVSETQAKEQQRSSTLSRTASFKRTSSHILRPRKLDPILEVTEPSEKERTTSSFASLVTVIRKEDSRSNSSQDPLNETCLKCVQEAKRQSVKQRIQALEEELSKDKRATLSTRSLENVRKYYRKSSSSDEDSASNMQPEYCPVKSEIADGSKPKSQEQLKRITNVINQVTRRSSAVNSLKNCFEEMAERLRNSSDGENGLPVPKTMNPPPVPPRNYRSCQEDASTLMPRKTGGQSLPPNFFKDKTVQDLLTRREELRVQCLQYYKSDGTLKDLKDMPAPRNDTKEAELRANGLIVGSYRALERLKRWRGKPKQLKFFKTCFRGCGLEYSGKLQALDRRFEQVALKWQRQKMLVCRRNTWRRYRRNMLAKKPSPTIADLLQMRHQLELQEELQRERMVHLAKIIELCRTHCSGVIRSDVLQKMLSRLDEEYAQLSGDLSSLFRQKEQLFQ
ncbi:uncharacterized protein LOC108037106 [Drosophila rhopaloa]|uniref:Uncharacterized protein LOC108037106 n=1 Tax=Drosophila rhopaloa TaxID=1041015 RepID=A0A6P4DU78_DRORH|nr:uncharacterized protein LOC108037106 [Drosophila rhopaloa]XP_016969075.1 uncharacterized protein LOC108037106 [Drosophila rhopaloa]